MKHRRTFAIALALTGFILGIRNGHLTLWRDGGSRPEQIYDIRADSLPPADRAALERGIRVKDREELWMILESYLE